MGSVWFAADRAGDAFSGIGSQGAQEDRGDMFEVRVRLW